MRTDFFRQTDNPSLKTAFNGLHPFKRFFVFTAVLFLTAAFVGFFGYESDGGGEDDYDYSYYYSTIQDFVDLINDNYDDVEDVYRLTLTGEINSIRMDQIRNAIGSVGKPAVLDISGTTGLTSFGFDYYSYYSSYGSFSGCTSLREVCWIGASL